MPDRSTRGVGRILRPACLTLATFALVMVAQMDGTARAPGRASGMDPGAWALASAGLDLPERGYRPARYAAAGAVAAPVESEEAAAPPVASAAPLPVGPAGPTTTRMATSAAPTNAAAAACPADWICYPRVGVAGPIVPYVDCSGRADVGTAIRAFVCLPGVYLLGHAHTQFGKITGWRTGDIVYAYGRPYAVTGAATQSSCASPLLPLAPLSLQTSLSPNACGPVLVVQAR